MRVYVVLARRRDCGNGCCSPEDDEGLLMEVFVNEQDAKKCKVAAEVDGAHGECFIRPRELRTAWRG